MNRIPFTAHALWKRLGSGSAPFAEVFPRLHQAITPGLGAYRQWCEAFFPAAPRLPRAVLRQFALRPDDDPRPLIFALQSYYALLVRLLVAYRLGDPGGLRRIADGSHFQRHKLLNLDEGGALYNWLFAADAPLDALAEAVVPFDFSSVPPDALKMLYEKLFPTKLRHSLGEYYTPDWLAELTLERVGYTGEGRLLDPACGSGTFLALALRRLPANYDSLQGIAGIDRHPLACLAARANLVLHLGAPDSPQRLPVHCADAILQPPQIGRFETIVGNPPWVNWETLPATYREQSRALWEHYGLFPHSGLESILGKGKKDLSLLLTYGVLDAYLAQGGKLAFILSQTVLKSSGAGAGFRRFRLPDGVPLRALHVDDLSRLKMFPGVSTGAALLVLQKGQPTRYPVPYTFWKRRKAGQSISMRDALGDVQAKTRQIPFVAQPIAEPESGWLSGKASAIAALHHLRGESDYAAHAGVYTGGANAVYWLEVLHQEEEGLLRVRNIIAGAKRPVPQVAALIEPQFVYPLLRGTDLQRWRAVPGAHILLVQDPHKRRGYDEDWLREHYPRTYAYLAQFEDVLRARATFKRYYRHSSPFYSMFDIGDYSLAPFKVVWQGFGTHTMQAAVVGSVAGKAVLSNQAMHPFIGLHDEDEAHYLAACLNSAPFEYAVLSYSQKGSKSFAQPGLLKRLRLPRYEADNPLHQRLVQHSRAAHAGPPDDAAIAEAAAQLWRLSPAQLADVLENLAQLR